MILEVAVLDVRPGQDAAFEAAFEEAQEILSASPGYQGHELRHCMEESDRYLLLVWWDTLESHTVGFRRSPAYERWRALLRCWARSNLRQRHGAEELNPTISVYESVVTGAGP